MHKYRNIQLLFDFVKETVWDKGGDGYGYIVSDDKEWLAEQFEKDEDWFTERSSYKDAIVFLHHQEAIIFIDKNAEISFPDVIVTVD